MTPPLLTTFEAIGWTLFVVLMLELIGAALYMWWHIRKYPEPEQNQEDWGV